MSYLLALVKRGRSTLLHNNTSLALNRSIRLQRRQPYLTEKTEKTETCHLAQEIAVRRPLARPCRLEPSLWIYRSSLDVDLHSTDASHPTPVL